ncbi:hypothetical protein HZS_396 [Henneguya salminicola]|nr:hypothetical protein HZS_396 [Henneguya salminicola]
MFLIPVPNRTRKTLTALITKWIKPGCYSRSFDIFLSNIRKIYNPYSIVSFHELPNLNRAESFFLPTHDNPMVFSFFIIRLKQIKFNKNTLSEYQE